MSRKRVYHIRRHRITPCLICGVKPDIYHCIGWNDIAKNSTRHYDEGWIPDHVIHVYTFAARCPKCGFEVEMSVPNMERARYSCIARWNRMNTNRKAHKLAYCYLNADGSYRYTICLKWVWRDPDHPFEGRDIVVDRTALVPSEYLKLLHL